MDLDWLPVLCAFLSISPLRLLCPFLCGVSVCDVEKASVVLAWPVP